MLRMAFLAAALAVTANVANAQITTYVAPGRNPKPTPEAVATADSVRKDSVAQTAMTNMKTWVDSASGVPVPAYVGRVDSAALTNDPGRPVVTTFSNGTTAPETASDLPALAVIGVLALVLGTIILERQSPG
jgi:hypothetical protein